MAVAKMRTVKATVDYFRNEDPDTQVNEYMLRRLVKQGKIPVVHVGSKILINLDKFIDYLNCESETLEEPEIEVKVAPGIRKVEV